MRIWLIAKKSLQWLSLTAAVLILVATIFGVGFLSGGGMALRQDSGGSALRQEYLSFSHLFRLAAVLSTIYSIDLEIGPLGVHWNPPSTPLEPNGPINHYDPSKSYPGVNLLLAGDSTSATLTAMDGTVLHRWSKKFSEVWPNPDHVQNFRPGMPINWRRAHVYPNGDILVVYESEATTPYGLGLAKLDKDSNIIWKFSGNIHHDISVSPDGRIFTLFQEISSKQYLPRSEFMTPYLTEGVAELDSDGNLLKKVYIMDAMMGSDHYPLFYTLFYKSLQGDFTHMNSVQYINNDLAQAVPFAKPGQILVSMREMNSIAILDMNEEKVVWSMTGLFQRQHDAQLLANGNLLVFDNFGHTVADEGATRILEIDPLTQSVKWKYTGTKENPLESLFFGSQQRLPNGNTMIVESMNGRVIEVTPDNEVVWQYRVQDKRTFEGVDYIPVINDMVRYEIGELTFLDEK